MSGSYLHVLAAQTWSGVTTVRVEHPKTGPLGDEDVGSVIRSAIGLGGDTGYRVLTIVRVGLVGVAPSCDNSLTGANP